MRWTAILVTISLAGCASTEFATSLSVREVMARQHELHGQVVIVRGWMIVCRRTWCRLTSSPGDPGELPSGLESLNVGGDADFKAAADMVAPAEIILKARVDASCQPDPKTDAIPLCIHGIDLQPIEIMRVIQRIDKQFK